MPRDKLSAKRVEKLKSPGRYGDGAGLWFLVLPQGRRSWTMRYMIAGRSREMGLGPYPEVTLERARELRDRARALLREGIDPIDDRRQRRTAGAAGRTPAVTFQNAAERFIDAHRAGWKSEKHAEQWTATLSAYVYPIFRSVPVAAVDTGMVLKALEPIWTTKAETAGRVRGRIERILDWAKARELRSGENPARWRGHLDKLLPPPRKTARVQHFAAMPYDDLPGFMVRLREAAGSSARALEFTILTAARTGEITGATWAEIDLKSAIWTVPGERMKSGRPHRVPLSDRAVAILKALLHEDGNEHVFIGGRAGSGLSNMAMLQTLRGMVPGLTVHGFRSTFRDWCAECTNYPREVAETALAHIVSDKTEAAYRRGDALEKRRRLMRDWATFCEAPARGSVTPIRKRSRA